MIWHAQKTLTATLACFLNLFYFIKIPVFAHNPTELILHGYPSQSLPVQYESGIRGNVHANVAKQNISLKC